MQQVQLESRPLYGIGTVARMTGLKPDTLRVWERRYGLGASHKSDTGRRQYTRSDMEHLQLVATLVRGGVRIGEIASVERKTLELMARDNAVEPPQARPRVLFVGQHLCQWLDEHQGCVAGVDAVLARVEPAELEGSQRTEIGAVDTLIVGCATLNAASATRVMELAQELEASRIMLVYRFGSTRWVEDMERKGVAVMSFPPEPARVAFEISQSVASKSAEAGDRNLGELVKAKPRQFTEQQLAAARKLQSSISCECPRHITDLIQALSNFEEYSTECAVEGWKDAAVHACIYTYTNQARWLMEKALSSVLEEHGGVVAVENEHQAPEVVSL